MKKLLASTALIVALALPASAQDYTPDPAAKPGGTITITYKDDVATLGSLLHRADGALYRAKQNGRNCITIAE